MGRLQFIDIFALALSLRKGGKSLLLRGSAHIRNRRDAIEISRAGG